MIHERRQQGKYKETDDNILKELESFQSFLYRHFKARFFAIAKTHKFENINDITIDNLKLCPIIDQTGTCYYKTGKVIIEY